MKIGTITFHWASNFGAVLQAYALQKYLIELGHDAEIINYVPQKVYVMQSLEALFKRDLRYFIKRKKLRKFIKKNLKCTFVKYKNNKALHKASFEYNAVICGSDQIWNPSFTLYGEGHPTLSYFLDFIDEKCLKIGYAVSFGADKVSQYYDSVVNKCLLSFDNISVREKTGQDILRNLGISAPVVCDPTLLLKREDYERMIDNKTDSQPIVFSYILHGQKAINSEILNTVQKKYNCQNIAVKEPTSLLDWIYQIDKAQIVVTNSFHGVMLSLILNTPFIALSVPGSSMDNRLLTILDYVGLEERFISGGNVQNVEKICNDSINWQEVNNRLEKYSVAGKEFIISSLAIDQEECI